MRRRGLHHAGRQDVHVVDLFEVVHVIVEVVVYQVTSGLI